MERMRPEPPTKDECERIRKLYADFEDAPDQLTTVALVVSIPRLLARIEHLEELLRKTVELRRTVEKNHCPACSVSYLNPLAEPCVAHREARA